MSNCKSFSKDISDVRADVECDTKIFYVTLLMICIGVLYVHESNQQKRIVAMEEKIKLLLLKQ